jgi:cytolysin-activating lysine-acyltransferase
MDAVISSPFTIQAPLLGHDHLSEAAVLGSVVWLWTQSDKHRHMPLQALHHLLMPAIKTGQYILASQHSGEQTQPVAYLAWANLDAKQEAHYVDNNNSLLPEAWNCGNRMWIIDWLAPTGQSQPFASQVAQLLHSSTARALYHKGQSQGLKVLYFKGSQMSTSQQRSWWQDKPILAVNTPT